jgi:hypothetical protein
MEYFLTLKLSFTTLVTLLRTVLYLMAISIAVVTSSVMEGDVARAVSVILMMIVSPRIVVENMVAVDPKVPAAQ